MNTEQTTPPAASPGTPDDLAELRRAREEAHRAYNKALTALDASIQQVRQMPAPPAPYDESQIASLNQQWELLPFKPANGGWLSRVRAYVWGVLAPVVEQQQVFNATMVNHLNRNAAVHRETTYAIVNTLTMCREQLEALLDFQTKLMLYLQQITAYVDTKDQYVAGVPNALAAGISGLSDELQKHWESMGARERRYEAQVGEIRSTLSVLQRAVQTVKRELERLGPTVGPPPPTDTAAPAAPRSSLDSYKYVGFEDQFRGSQGDIRERATAYVSLFEGARDVLDVGCGRGEFLELLRERGISARGVDLNEEMAAVCRARGLEATAGDALGYLLAQPDESIGGLFAAQVVEHMEPDYLIRLLETACHKLRPGSKIVLETINAACWYAFFSSYIRDVTHVRPLHPDTLRYLLIASGFQRVELRYSAPFPEESKLQPLPALSVAAPGSDSRDTEVVRLVNENVSKLNELLFTYMDYAAIGERL